MYVERKRGEEVSGVCEEEISTYVFVVLFLSYCYCTTRAGSRIIRAVEVLVVCGRVLTTRIGLWIARSTSQQDSQEQDTAEPS